MNKWNDMWCSQWKEFHGQEAEAQVKKRYEAGMQEVEAWRGGMPLPLLVTSSQSGMPFCVRDISKRSYPHIQQEVLRLVDLGILEPSTCRLWGL